MSELLDYQSIAAEYGKQELLTITNTLQMTERTHTEHSLREKGNFRNVFFHKRRQEDPASPLAPIRLIFRTEIRTLFRSHIREQAPQVKPMFSCSIGKRKSDPVSVDCLQGWTAIENNIEMYKAKTAVRSALYAPDTTLRNGIAVIPITGRPQTSRAARRQTPKTTAHIDDKTRFRNKRVSRPTFLAPLFRTPGRIHP